MFDHAHKLWHFHGGLHLEAHKRASTREPILLMRVPRWIILPLQQHIGEAAEPLVRVGDHVKKGQLIARATSYVSAGVHASTSGVVHAIEPRPVPHPSGLSAPCIVIETDGKEEWSEEHLPPMEGYDHLDPVALRNRVREAGLVGLGGAAFPTAVKLNPGNEKPIDTLILNGAECEPYISCDDMLMRERAPEIVEGLRIIRHALGPKHCIIGIEDNKPEAFEALCEALGGEEAGGIRIARVPTIYPAGGERQLIKVLTGREAPSNGLPADIGVICHNVGTAVAVFHAVALGEPLLSRVVTVTGGGVSTPRNLEVLLGTPISELIEYLGGYTDKAERLIMGGPMMGFALPSDEAPVIKGSNCILVAAEHELSTPGPAMPCIRCGDCVSVCPARLLPQQLYWFARAKDFDRAQDYALFDCIECGCCATVCPSNIPLVQYYRFAKTEIWASEREKQKADIARRRHDARLERLEREKREKAERHARKQAALKKPDTAEEDPKKAAIKAALARSQAKKAQSAVKPRNVDNLTEAQQREIEDIDRRREAARDPTSGEE